MNKQKLIIINIISVILMAITSFSLMLSLVVDFNAKDVRGGFSYIASILFWCSLIFGWAFQIVSYLTIKDKIEFKSPPGIIKFFSNRIALITDISMIILLILCVVFLFLNVSDWLKLLFISLFVFAFQLHIVLNSKNFKYIFNLNKLKKRGKRQ